MADSTDLPPTSNPLRHIALQSGQQMGIIISELPPELGQSLLGLCVSGILLQIPDPQWSDLMKEAGQPCEKPGCDCHKLGEFLFPALDAVRSWQKVKSPTAWKMAGGRGSE